MMENNRINQKEMGKTKFEEMFDRLPSNIKETEVLRFTSKKVLAALLDLLIHSDAKESGIIFCQNERLIRLAGIGKNGLLPAIQQLIDYDLISRVVGKGEGIASEYRINFKRLLEPLTEKTFGDLFSCYIKDQNLLKSPLVPTISITRTIPTSTTIPTTTPITTLHGSEVDGKNGGIFIDAMDYEEDNSFEEDLEKRVWYAKWDNEDREERMER